MILVADIHIKLGQKNVPVEWQTNRILDLALELNKASMGHDLMVIAGDLLDSAKPTVFEVGLMYDFLSLLNQKQIILIPGNHELGAKKQDCYVPLYNMLRSLNIRVIREFTTIDGIDYIPYNILKESWPSTTSKFAITHVRGTVPPHVEPEIDLQKFSRYDTVFTGDLHCHKMCQENLVYPGSPITTSFHRAELKGSNGYLTIDNHKNWEWFELKLPQLIRKTISDPKDMVATDFHHTIYELEGDMETLAKVQNSDLLDKKISKDISKDATLKFKGERITDELFTYFEQVLEEDPKPYIAAFKEVVSDSD